MPDQPLDESAADLLTDWRLAERDVSAARAGQVLAVSVLAAAEAAEEAAQAAELAAEGVVEAALHARAAAERARKAARRSLEETQIHTATAQGEKARADQAVGLALHVEVATHERFRRSQNGKKD
jgi:predicted RecA/RadA family phage recombinase